MVFDYPAGGPSGHLFSTEHFFAPVDPIAPIPTPKSFPTGAPSRTA
jgi:hypothetical protein